MSDTSGLIEFVPVFNLSKISVNSILRITILDESNHIIIKNNVYYVSEAKRDKLILMNSFENYTLFSKDVFNNHNIKLEIVE